MMVYCVICMDGDSEVVHIFSTKEKAAGFADSDERNHVIYDYLIDHPERIEGASQ